MSKIKLPDANFLASYVRFMKANNEKPCGSGEGDGFCNKSTVLTVFALRNTGMKFDFYNGLKCKHGYPASGGAIAYMLDNYASPAIKAPCDPSWKTLFQGTIAILMYQNAYGDLHYNPLDIWCIDGSFHQQILDEGAAKAIWIWTLGNVTSSKIKSRHTSRRVNHSPVIF